MLTIITIAFVALNCIFDFHMLDVAGEFNAIDCCVQITFNLTNENKKCSEVEAVCHGENKISL